MTGARVQQQQLADVAQTHDQRQKEPADDILTTFDRIASQQPNHCAVVSLRQKDSLGVGTIRWTYAELRDGSIRLAKRLLASGVPRGSRVATFMYNDAEWALLFLACARMGCHFVPLDPRALNTTSDAIYLLRKVWAQSIFVSTLEQARIVEKILDAELMPQIFLKGLISPLSNEKSLPRGWRTLAKIMTSPSPKADENDDDEAINLKPLDKNDTILMLCTSGTTSRPKVCPHTSVTITTPALGLADHLSLDPDQSLCQHLPSFHVFYVALTLAFWVSGGTVVVPSPEFNPAATFEGLGTGPKVWMACVPTMVYALQTYASAMDEPVASPYGVVLGGAPITSQALKSCRELGAQTIVAGYGTTEGVATLYNVLHRDDAQITESKAGDETCLGTAVAGTHLRICAPESRIPIERNQIGELHQGGYPVFSSYYQATPEQNLACYREGSINWFATGDRGYMDQNGNIYLLGRYKDLIIRSGENISPLKIEQCLTGQAGIATSVVVGVPDDIAGEVPVAVIETTGPMDLGFIKQMQSAVLKDLGRSFAPKLILHLQNDLGRQHYPTTTSGKIKKNVVQEWVVAHLGLSSSSPSSSSSSLSPSSVSSPVMSTASTVASSILPTPPVPSPVVETGDLTSQLISLWASVSGLSPQEIQPDTDVRTFTDSTMLIQFVDEAKKKGLKMTLKQVFASNTIEKQARLLENIPRDLPPPEKMRNSKHKPVADQQPTSVARASAGRRSPSARPQVPPRVDVKKQRAAAALGVREGDIEQLLPMTDIFQMLSLDRPFPGAWDMRHCYQVRRPLGQAEVMAIAETWFCRHELLRSVVATVEGEPPVFAVMQPRRPWLDQQVIAGPEVDSMQDVCDFEADDYLDSGSGPLCKLKILPIRGTDRCGLIMHLHHAVFDGHVAERWIRDLNHLLDGRPQMHWQPYRDFAVSYKAYRASPDAQDSIDYYMRKLSGISSATDSIWSPRRILESMKKYHPLPSSSSDSPTSSSSSSSSSSPLFEGPRPFFTQRIVPDEMINIHVHLPHVTQMRTQYGISPPIIALAACALINVRYTDSSEAIFSNLQSGRSWPLESSSYSSTSPLHHHHRGPASTIDGPTLSNCPARISVSPSHDTALSLLRRCRAEQDDMMLHAHVPTGEVLSRITARDGERGDAVLMRLITGQQYNWLAEPYTERVENPLEMRGQTSYGQSHWVWLPRLDNKTGMMHLHLNCPDPDMPQERAGIVAEEFLCAAAWLADPGNAGRVVGECDWDGLRREGKIGKEGKSYQIVEGTEENVK